MIGSRTARTAPRARRPPHGAAHERAPAQTVERALTVLGFFTATTPELSSADVGARLGLHQTTAYRLLTTMEAAGYVERDARTGLYRLGLRVVELAGLKLNQMDLYRHALPELDALRDQLDLNANLAVLDGGDVCHLAYSVRRDVPQYYTALGRKSVAHCTALGKVLLAAMPREEVHATIDRCGWRPYTPRSIQDFETLDQCLDEVAQQGYAVELGERSATTNCVAAPIRDRTGGVVAALSVSGRPEQVQALTLEKVVEVVTERAAFVSSRLGHLDSWRR